MIYRSGSVSHAVLAVSPTEVKIAGAAPPVRNGQAVAFDHERGQLVLFGGFLGNVMFGDTWVFDDGAWREAAP